jgi:hypothetical protein
MAKSNYVAAALALLSVLMIAFWLPSVARHVKECFVDRGQPDTNHNVDIPLTTTVECRNVCGPRQTCALTGESCTSNVDCAGCQPPPISAPPRALVDPEPAEEGSAYTSLDWGAPLQTAGPDTPAPAPEQRTNTWRSSFDTGNRLFQASQQDGFTDSESSPYSLSYPPSGRTTLSGEFADDGPLPSNRPLLNGTA